MTSTLNNFRLNDRVALVTGASTGLGAAIAIALAGAGAHVACHGNSRSPETTVEQINNAAGVAHAVTGARLYANHKHRSLTSRRTPQPPNPRAHPAGRWGETDDIAGAAIVLSSPASDYVNGHILVVDGGWLSR